MLDQKNLFLAIILSLTILLGFQFLVEGPRREQREQQQQQVSDLPAPTGVPGAPGAPVGTAPQSRDDIIADDRRVPIKTPSLTGSVNLADGRIDDIVLSGFRETIEPDSDNIVLLSPTGSESPYFAEFGWVDGSGNVFGAVDANWSTRQAELTANQPIVLEATLDNGLRLTRTVAVDQDYMFTITQQAVNDSEEAVRLFPFGPHYAGQHARYAGVFHPARRSNRRIRRQSEGGRLQRPAGRRQRRTGTSAGLDRHYRQILAYGVDPQQGVTRKHAVLLQSARQCGPLSNRLSRRRTGVTAGPKC